MSVSLHPWLTPIAQQLSAALQLGRLHHAILLQGQQGTGKSALTHFIAAGLVCDRTADLAACGQCKSCLLFNAGNHPDCLSVTSEGLSIGVDDIRKASGFVQQASQISVKRVLVINHAEKLTEAAANALLKTLEEPSGNSHLLLTCDNPARLLATIRSRCFKIAVNVADKAMVYQWLQQQFSTLQPDELAQSFALLFKLSNHAPIKMAQWIAEGKLSEIAQATECFQGWLNSTLATAQYQQQLAQSEFALLLFHYLLVEHWRSLALTHHTELAQMQNSLAQLRQFASDAQRITGQNKSLALLNLLTGLKTNLAGELT